MVTTGSEFGVESIAFMSRLAAPRFICGGCCHSLSRSPQSWPIRWMTSTEDIHVPKSSSAADRWPPRPWRYGLARKIAGAPPSNTFTDAKNPENRVSQVFAWHRRIVGGATGSGPAADSFSVRSGPNLRLSLQTRWVKSCGPGPTGEPDF